MRSIELYNRVIGWFDQAGITQLFSWGVAAILIAALLLSIGRLRALAHTLGVVGVLTLMFALFLIHEQQVVERKDEFVTIKHWRYSEAARFQARVALLGLPAAAAFAMMQVLWTTQRRRRRTLPTHLKDGRICLVRGDYDAAMASYNHAVKIAPYLGEGYLQRGCVYEAKGDAAAAMADYDHALKCDPRLAAAYLRRGRLRTEMGELDAAADDFDRFMSIRPNDVEGYLNRGICFAKKGDAARAIADFQRVLKLTNHSDYADPARTHLAQLLGPEPALESAATHASVDNGSPHPALETASPPHGDDPR
jgi:tetratricopeptide (TPR) repeat protein